MEKWYLQDVYNVIKAMEKMSACDKNCKKEILDLHENDMKKLLSFYRHLKNENRQFLEEVDQECRDQIREGMAYALEYLDIYDPRVDMKKLCTAMDDVVFLYGLSDMIDRCLALVRCFVPTKGNLYNNIIRGYFCSTEEKSDDEVIGMLPEFISRRQYYREKKEAIRWTGYYFFEVVVPEMKRRNFKFSDSEIKR